jgi:hypothetical protein
LYHRNQFQAIVQQQGNQHMGLVEEAEDLVREAEAVVVEEEEAEPQELLS